MAQIKGSFAFVVYDEVHVSGPQRAFSAPDTRFAASTWGRAREWAAPFGSFLLVAGQARKRQSARHLTTSDARTDGRAIALALHCPGV